MRRGRLRDQGPGPQRPPPSPGRRAGGRAACPRALDHHAHAPRLRRGPGRNCPLILTLCPPAPAPSTCSASRPARLGPPPPAAAPYGPREACAPELIQVRVAAATHRRELSLAGAPSPGHSHSTAGDTSRRGRTGAAWGGSGRLSARVSRCTPGIVVRVLRFSEPRRVEMPAVWGPLTHSIQVIAITTTVARLTRAHLFQMYSADVKLDHTVSWSACSSFTHVSLHLFPNIQESTPLSPRGSGPDQ